MNGLFPEIRKCITINDHDTAFDKLEKIIQEYLEFAGFKQSMNDLILLKSQLNHILRLESVNVADKPELIQNRVIKSFLELVDKVEALINDGLIPCEKNKQMGLIPNGSLPKIELKIGGDLSLYSPEKCHLLLQGISALLSLEETIVITQIKSGSIQITIELPEDKARQLVKISKRGLLKEYGVEKVRVFRQKQDEVKEVVTHIKISDDIHAGGNIHIGDDFNVSNVYQDSNLWIIKNLIRNNHKKIAMLLLLEVIEFNRDFSKGIQTDLLDAVNVSYLSTHPHPQDLLEWLYDYWMINILLDNSHLSNVILSANTLDEIKEFVNKIK